MILAAYLSCWRALRPGVRRVLLTALVLGVGGCHLLWYALPAGKPNAPVSDVEAQYSRFGSRVVWRGGR